MMKRFFSTFFILILCSIPASAAFHELFEDDVDSKKLALQILSNKYHALAKWFSYQRCKQEWIPFDDGLAHKALDMAFAYSDWLHELRSKYPDMNRIKYLKEKIRLAREGESLPSNYKNLPINEVWEQNGPSKGYKVLKAYARATRPNLPWPGKIYDHNLLKILYESKAAKYLLLSTLPNKDEKFMQDCLTKVEHYEVFASHEASIIKKQVFIPSPILTHKKKEDNKETDTVLVSKNPLLETDEPAPLVPERDDLVKSGEYDDPIFLKNDDPEDQQPPLVRTRVPRKRIVNIPRSNATDFSTLRELAEEANVSPIPLTAEQKKNIEYLIKEAGMTEDEAYATIVGVIEL